MDRKVEVQAMDDAPDELFTIDGITVRVHFSTEQLPNVMEKIEALLFENLCAK